MEGKIVLYNEYDQKVGETFVRRARQLVKQQRAEWIGDSQNAIRFVADVEDWEVDTIAGDTSVRSDKSEEWLIPLAEKRIVERKRFIIHSIVAIPTWLFLVMIAGYGGEMFFTGVCLTAYLIHVYQFAIPRLMKYRSHDRKERKARALAAEVAILKAEMQK